MEIIYIVCAGILLFLGGSFLFKHKKQQADYILLAWIIIEFFTQISYYLLQTSGIGSNIVFFQIISGTNLLHAPLLYLYIVALLDKDFSFTLKRLTLLIPVLLFYLIHLPVFSKVLGSSACSVHYSCYLMNKPCSILFNVSKLILNTFYLTLTLFTFLSIRSRNERLMLHEKLDWAWAKLILTGVFFINFLILIFILSKISRIEIFSTEFFILHFISTLFVILFCFIYFNFRNIVHFMHKWSTIFRRDKITGNVQTEKADKNGLCSMNKNYDFALSQEQLDKYQEIVLQYIEEKKPYLDHHLTKEKFNTKTGIPEHHMAVVLRECFQKTFTDFINTYRLQALIEKLEKSQNETFTLLSLAYDCGFNSKSTFNRFFKSQMMVTPSEWLKTPHLSDKIEGDE